MLNFSALFTNVGMNSIQKENPHSTPSKNVDSSEYVDIFFISSKIGLFFNNTKRLFLKNLFLILILAGLGFAVGVGLHMLRRPYYASSMVISTGDLKPMIARTLLSRLSADIDDKSHGTLAQKLNIPLQAAQSIRDLSVTGYIDQIKEETEQDSTLSQINLELRDVTHFTTMQNALVKYIENTDAFQLNQKLNRTQTLAFMERISQDIRKIDSLKTSNKENTGSGTVVIYGDNERAAELFKQGNDLYKQQLELENYLTLENRVRVIAPFTPRTKPSGPSLGLHGTLGLLMGLILALIIANHKEKKGSIA